jgi:hypothetical protein
VKSTIALGLLLFVIFSISFAPATLLQAVLPADAGAKLLAPVGTVWNGDADLLLGGAPAGTVRWRFRPGTLMQGRMGYDLGLAGADHDLTGGLALGATAATVDLDGRTSAAFMNQWLAPYDIALSGDFALHGISLHIPYNLRVPDGPPTTVGAASGSLSWAGGALQYRLAGQIHAGSLPPLVAHLGDALEAVVYEDGGHTPLLRAEVLNNGFVRIGMTKLLTRLVGNPWPGSHAEHEVVLEVEELLF